MVTRVPSEILALTQEEIAVRAYHLWEQEGRPLGRDKDHWQRAEHQLLDLHKQEERALRGWEKAHGLRPKQRRHAQAI